MSIPGSIHPLFLGAAGQAAGGYQITRSLRFNSSDSAYLSRTPASAGNRKTWTWAGWVKRCKTGQAFRLLGQDSYPSYTFCGFTSGDKLYCITIIGGSTVYMRQSIAVYRDASAWYHVVIIHDTTDATTSNRYRFYVNGSLVATELGEGSYDYPVQNTDGYVNAALLHHINYSPTVGTSSSGDGYLADIHFIDGQALTPSSFTEVSATTGQLVPKAYTGSYGTNGFYLNWTGPDSTPESGSILSTSSYTGIQVSTSSGVSYPSSCVDGNFDTAAIMNGETTITFNTAYTSTGVLRALIYDGGGNALDFRPVPNVDSGIRYYPNGSGYKWIDIGTNVTFQQIRTWVATVYIYALRDDTGVITESGSVLTAASKADRFKIGNFVKASNSTGGPVYSDMVGADPGYSPWTAIFDGTDSDQIITGGELIFRPTTPIPFSTLEIKAHNRGGSIPVYYVNGSLVNGGSQFDGVYQTISTNGTLTELRAAIYNDWSPALYGIKVNGQLLIDTPYTISGYISSINSSNNTIRLRGVTGTWSTGNTVKGLMLGNIGRDESGNANHLTAANISTVNGTGKDNLVDTPTSYGTDTGVGGEVRGNFCTWNPLSTGGSTALSNGNLDVASSAANETITSSTIGMSSGKWYFEYTVNTYSSSGNRAVGLIKQGVSISSYLGTANGWGYNTNGKTYANGGLGVTYGNTWTTPGDVIGIAFDADNGNVYFYKNGVVQNSGTAAFTGLTSGPYFFACDTYTGWTASANFGQRPFAYTAPSGFKALCDTNLPAPVVAKPSTVMDVKLYTGNGSTQTISGYNFSPDFAWIKARNGAVDHVLYDQIRGVQKYLSSNTTGAEGNQTGTPNVGLYAFTSDGFSVGDISGGSYGVNGSSGTYVAWAWDAGSSTVANTQGSISSQVRANASAGFSIVTYSGNSSTATVGHGLNVAPSWIIIKNRTSAYDWIVYANESGTLKQLYLNLTLASSGSGLSLPSSTTFNLPGGGASGSNETGKDYVAYCFAPVAGYSSFGSYVGNGSSDGVFQWCGFRPRWILIKASSAVSFGSWRLFDTARDTYNVCGNQLIPNLADAEYGPGATGTAMDILSNGFKLRSSFDGWNGSGATYIYAAFAENPFQYSRAR